MKSNKIRNFPRDPDCRCVNCGERECCWAHLRYHDSGMGQKCPDIFGAVLCKQCHDYVDGRDNKCGLGIEGDGQNDIEFHYRVMRRSLALLITAGIVRVC